LDVRIVDFVGGGKGAVEKMISLVSTTASTPSSLSVSVSVTEVSSDSVSVVESESRILVVC